MSLFLYALPLSLLFVTLSDQWSPEGLIVGYIVSLGVMALTGNPSEKINLIRLPGLFFWLCVYILRLAWDIFVSGIDVARRVLDPRLPINPGELMVSTQDARQEVLISALSAHAITVTPGEMVEDFEEIDGETHMVVHSLDMDASREKVEHEQTNRLQLLERIVRGSKQ